METNNHKYHWLRKRAESVLNANKKNRYLDETNENAENINVLIHELEVHKIELEMQNRALEATQEEIETSRMMYYDLFDNAPAGYVILDQSGIIQQANLSLAKLLETTRSALLGKDIHEYITFSERDNLYLHLKKVFGSSPTQLTGVWMKTEKEKEIWVLLQSHQTGDGQKTPQCSMIISDLTSLIKNL